MALATISFANTIGSTILGVGSTSSSWWHTIVLQYLQYLCLTRVSTSNREDVRKLAVDRMCSLTLRIHQMSISQ